MSPITGLVTAREGRHDDDHSERAERRQDPAQACRSERTTEHGEPPRGGEERGPASEERANLGGYPRPYRPQVTRRGRATAARRGPPHTVTIRPRTGTILARNHRSCGWTCGHVDARHPWNSTGVSTPVESAGTTSARARSCGTARSRTRPGDRPPARSGSSRHRRCARSARTADRRVGPPGCSRSAR